MAAIKMNAKTCQVCGKYTSWDESYGHENFIICPRCMEIAREKLGYSTTDIIGISCAFGEIRKENKK